MAKVLVIGSGGREHALCYKFAASSKVDTVYVAPGNSGMKDVATVVDIKVNDFEGLANFAKENQIDLTFVGPEIPLCAGIVDYFKEQGLCIFGPTKAAARLEGSKCFSKDMMKKYHIPTAAYQSFNDYEKAAEYLKTCRIPVVLKADGLAAGKGVIIPETMEEAEHSLKEMMCDGLFNSAGSSVVIEEFLQGEEFSLLAFVNGEHVYPMQIAQDHKRAFDNDEGLNTGGMGAYTPVTHISQKVIDEAMDKVMKPMAKAMVEEGCPFTGILYGGLMATADGVRTIEFNVRFGDPETEVILQAMSSDLYETVMDVLQDKTPTITFDDKCYIGVVLAAKGYPEKYNKGAVIKGLDTVLTRVFHMGTKEINGEVTANGGRVLFVSANGKTMEEVKETVYNEIAKIKCDDLFYRKDIAHRALKGDK